MWSLCLVFVLGLVSLIDAKPQGLPTFVHGKILELKKNEKVCYLIQN